MIADSTLGIDITTRGFGPMSLQLTKDDVGKKYVCRDGRIATSISYDYGSNLFPFQVEYDDGYTDAVQLNGRVYLSGESCGDLLREVPGIEAGPDKPPVPIVNHIAEYKPEGARLTRGDDGKEYICRNGKLVTVKFENYAPQFPFSVYHEGEFKCTVDSDGVQSSEHEPGLDWDVIRLATDAERIAAAPLRSCVPVTEIPTIAEIDEAKTRLGVVKESNPKDAVGVRKVPFSTLPWPVIAEVGAAMLEGARKYGRHNYREIGVRASVYFDASMRHQTSFWEGEDIDPDSKIHHLSKAIATLAVLRDAMIRGKCVDDRPRGTKGFIKALNTKAAEICDMYPDAKEPFLGNGQSDEYRAA